MIEKFTEWLNAANAILWGPPMVILLFGTHLYFTFRLGFIQRFVGKGIRLTFGRQSSGEGDISHFGALATALAATVGTGNIVGVATAIGLGGPGAVLWMWLTGVFGMATKYAEAYLAVHFRKVNARGEMIGGPMEVIHQGLGWKWLAVIFAACAFLASFGIGNMVQANSIADQTRNLLPDLEPWMVAVPLCILVGSVTLGGVKIIARACMVLVPIMVILYVGGCAVILLIHIEDLLPAIGTILHTAFVPEAAGGGFIGAAIAQTMRYGIARGLFSNESGLGSGGFFAAAARTRTAMQQSLVSMTGTFWDTVVICLMTGLVLVSSGAWEQVGPDGQTLRGADLTNAAFAAIPVIGPFVLTAALLTFVFSTLIGWSYIGEKSAEYLLGVRAVLPFRFLWIAAAYVGATSALDLVWNFADFANALMILPNILSLLLLSGLVARETRRNMEDPHGLLH